MDTFKRLVEFVQLPAKTACLLPFTLALCYTAYVYRTVNIPDTAVFFLSMFCFELSVTGLNNYLDTRADGKPLPIPRPAAKRILTALLAAAMSAGLLLAVLTGPVVLFCGAACFFIGVAYSFGPKPLSHLPLGEALSGLFEGFGIPFLTVYISAPHSLFDYALQGGVLTLAFRLPGLFRLGLLCVPCALCIANIMLANNICDAEDDVRVGRRTLPYYLGRANSLRLFALDYYLSFAAVVLLAVFRVLPPWLLPVSLVLFIFVQRNISVFWGVQSKSRTFPLSVVNFACVVAPLIALAFSAALLR